MRARVDRSGIWTATSLALLAGMTLTVGDACSAGQAARPAGAPDASAPAGQRPVARYCTNCGQVVALRGPAAAEGAVASAGGYEVVVRFAQGGQRTFRFSNDPGVRVGEQVRVNNGVIQRDQ